MVRWVCLLSCLTACLMGTALAGCSSEYHARRAARREERLAARESRRHGAMMEVCGDAQRAFERGHNAGLARHPMDTSWVARCPPELQRQQTDAYLSGYQQGAARAPTQVVVPVVPAPPTVRYGAPVEACRFSSDCGASRTCRQWGNAGSVCMGFGGAGSPCWFGSDCLSSACDGASRTCR